MDFLDEFLSSAPPSLKIFGDGPAAIYQPQPVVNQTWYENGKRCRSTMSLREAQRALDGNPNLTSDEYDSFWLGWQSSG